MALHCRDSLPKFLQTLQEQFMYPYIYIYTRTVIHPSFLPIWRSIYIYIYISQYIRIYPHKREAWSACGPLVETEPILWCSLGPPASVPCVTPVQKRHRIPGTPHPMRPARLDCRGFAGVLPRVRSSRWCAQGRGEFGVKILRFRSLVGGSSIYKGLSGGRLDPQSMYLGKS